MYTDIAAGIFIWAIALSPLLIIVACMIYNIDKNKREQARWNSLSREQQDAEQNHKIEMDIQKKNAELAKAYSNGYSNGYADGKKDAEMKKFKHDVQNEMYRQKVHDVAKILSHIK